MIGPIDTVRRWWRNGEDSPSEVRGSSGLSFLSPKEPPWITTAAKAGIPRSLVYPSTTLGRLVDQAADRFPTHTALLYKGKRWTYAELLGQVNRMAGGLAQLGVRRTDRVLLTLPNCPEFIIAFFAVQKIGGVVVNAGPLMGPDDLKALIEMTSPRVVVGLDLQAETLADASRHSAIEHWVWVSLQPYQTMARRMGYQIKLWQSRGHSTGAAHVTFIDLMENAPARPPTLSPDPEYTAVLQPTGGTTGTLKVAQLSHRNLLSNAAQVALWMNGHSGQERILAVLPMFHVYSLMTCLISGIYLSAEIIVMTRFSAEAVLHVLQEYKPTMFPLVPAICAALSDEIEKQEQPEKIEGLRLCISGAAPLPMEVAERFTRLTGAQVIEGYGLTEASPVTHANLIGQPRAGSIGLPLPDTQCRVADPDYPENDMPQGEAGELLICGPQVMLGYLGNRDATAAALFEDHGKLWLRTGDIVRVDQDGYFYVLDRKKDMIIRSGMKVYPARVEKLLLTHPRVKEAAVIDRPDLVHTSIVVAVIALKEPGEQTATLADELRTLCREHLAPYEVPASFEFVEALPRSALGKVLKQKLRDSGRAIGESSDSAQKAPSRMMNASPVMPAARSNGNGDGAANSNGNGKHPSGKPDGNGRPGGNGNGHRKEAA